MVPRVPSYHEFFLCWTSAQEWLVKLVEDVDNNVVVESAVDSRPWELAVDEDALLRNTQWSYGAICDLPFHENVRVLSLHQQHPSREAEQQSHQGGRRRRKEDVFSSSNKSLEYIKIWKSSSALEANPDIVLPKIVNWKSHLKFPEEAKLSAEAKDLISRLFCNVNQKLGSKGADEIKVHPWFEGVDWDRIYYMEAAFIPTVNDELDTQNFEKFDESDKPPENPSKSGPWRKMLSSKDINFVGYTYKNFEIVNDYQVPGMAELKRKNTKPKRPTIKSLFEEESEPSETASNGSSSQGNFLNMLPLQLEVSEKQNNPSM